MDLTKLFEMQAKLDEHIMDEHPELRENESNLDWKLLALQVELGECANEWRGFKKWSKDQEPRRSILTTAGATEENAVEYKCTNDDCRETFDASDENLKDLWGEISEDCPKCDGGILYPFRSQNPLLEEYVDCLHFILSIGIELDLEEELDWDEIETEEEDITKQFLSVNVAIADLADHPWLDSFWRELFEEFYILGKMLGFTWEQVEQAYFDKNKINHERQISGY